MADSVTLKEFLAVLSYRVDESAQRRFLDAITSMTNTVLGLGAGITAAAGGVVAAVANMASSGAQMSYLAATLNTTVSNVDAVVYAWQRLGMAPQQTMAVLQNLANMMYTKPGFAGLWEKYAGPGSIPEQLQHFGENFLKMDYSGRFAARQQLEQFLGPDFFNAILTRGNQVGEGVGEFNMAKRLFRFDPDYFSQQSVQFERAWQSFQLRLNDIMGHGATPILERMTASLRAMTEWLDAHADEILTDLDKIGKAVGDAFADGVQLVRDLTGWFNKLSPASQEAATAIALLGAAFLKPGWARIAAIAYAIETLLRDYEAFQRTGQSPLGIPWAEIGSQIDFVVKKLGELNQATGGLITPLHALEAYFSAKFVLAFVSGFGTIKTVMAETAVATGALLRSFGPIIAAIAAIETFRKAQDPQTYAPENLSPNSPFWRGMPASEFRKRYPDQPLPPGVVEGQGGAPGSSNGGSSVWNKLGDFLSHFSLISPAKADELPDNVKQLSNQMAMLNDTLSGMADAGTGGFGGWAAGLGAGVVSGLFGGGASGGQDAVRDINNPKAIEAVKYLMSKGVGMVQAIAMVSNMMAESGLSSTIVNDSGHAGLRQWDHQRQATFQSLYGKPLTSASMHEQLDYAVWEQQHSEAMAGFMLNKAQSIPEAIAADYHFNERPGSNDRSLGKRLNYGSALGSNPNLATSTFNGGSSVTQTNNVTINTSADPNAVGRAWDEYNRRHWADIQRNQQGAFQ